MIQVVRTSTAAPRRKTLTLLLIACCAFACCATAAHAARVCNVRAYGAKANGTTMDTQAIQHAIDACAAKGGGIVRLSAGTYLTGLTLSAV